MREREKEREKRRRMRKGDEERNREILRIFNNYVHSVRKETVQGFMKRNTCTVHNAHQGQRF